MSMATLKPPRSFHPALVRFWSSGWALHFQLGAWLASWNLWMDFLCVASILSSSCLTSDLLRKHRVLCAVQMVCPCLHSISLPILCQNNCLVYWGGRVLVCFLCLVLACLLAKIIIKVVSRYPYPHPAAFWKLRDCWPRGFWNKGGVSSAFRILPVKILKS